MLKNKNDNAPISIGSERLPDMYLDVIINLSDQAEDPSLEPKKIHEIVPASEEKKSLARVKWKTYKGLNYSIKSHKVN
jgi:DNA polymerase IIIc chi subunit